MKPASKQNKGKRLETFICHEIEKAGLGKAIRTPGSGSGLIKSDIFSSLDFSIECKHQKKIRILEWIDQAKQEAKIGNYDPNKWIIVFNDFREKPEFTEVYAVIDLWELLDLLKRSQEPKIKTPDRELKWEIRKLIQSAKEVLKNLEK